MRKTILLMETLIILGVLTVACRAQATQAPTAFTAQPSLSSGAPRQIVVPTNQNGLKLAALLNNLHVENYWAKGQYVNWETGATIAGPVLHWATDKATHCSGYASAVAAILNVPLLHPPFPSGAYASLFANTYGETFRGLAASSDSLLANKQGNWLADHAQASLPAAPYTTASLNNWIHVNAFQAQSYADQGYFALAVYINPDPASPGHIAIIAPTQSGITIGDYPHKSSSYTSLAVDGPYEAQSGDLNSSYTTVSRGFAPFDGPSVEWFGVASSQDLVIFYLYDMPIDWDAVSIPQAVK